MARRTIARVVDDSAVWRERIIAAHEAYRTASVESAIALGNEILQAKAALTNKSFVAMVKDGGLPFSRVWAYKLMAVAGSQRLGVVKRTLQLPSNVETLVELTKLDEETWGIAEERGLIRPDVTRKEIVALRHEIAPVEAEPEKVGPPFDVTGFLVNVHEIVLKGFRRCSEEQRSRAIKDLRALLNTLSHWKDETA